MRSSWSEDEVSFVDCGLLFVVVVGGVVVEAMISLLNLRCLLLLAARVVLSLLSFGGATMSPSLFLFLRSRKNFEELLLVVFGDEKGKRVRTTLSIVCTSQTVLFRRAGFSESGGCTA